MRRRHSPSATSRKVRESQHQDARPLEHNDIREEHNFIKSKDVAEPDGPGTEYEDRASVRGQRGHAYH